MNKLKYLTFAIMLGFVAVSCGDSDDLAPVVNITSPTNGSIYAVSDPIILTGTVTEDTKLSTVILSSGLGQDLDLSPLDSDTLHTFNYTLTLDSLTTPGAYTLTINATDDSGNIGSKSAEITIQ